MGNSGRPLALDMDPGPRRVNLGCGSRPIPGFENVDLCPGPGVDLQVDLLLLPLPWDDDSLDLVTAFDVLEHMPHHVDGFEGDFFWHLINDVLRCIKDGGLLEVHTPHHLAPDAMSVPDHLRVVGLDSFRPWMQHRFPQHDNNARLAVNGVALHIVRKRVGRHLQVGPISDYHFRKYLKLEVGRPSVSMLVMRVVNK